MRFSLFLTLFLFNLLILLACSPPKSATDHAIDKPIITLSKSKCFGKCKVYEVKVYADKSITYEGIMFVDSIGKFDSNIGNEDYDRLVAQFEKIDFQNLDSSYLTGSSDVQNITLGYNQKKVVYHNRAAPDSLKAITMLIDELVEIISWY